MSSPLDVQINSSNDDPPVRAPAAGSKAPIAAGVTLALLVVVGAALGVYFGLRGSASPSSTPPPSAETVASGVAYTPRIGYGSCTPIRVTLTSGSPDSCVAAASRNGLGAVSMQLGQLRQLNDVYRTLSLPGSSGERVSIGTVSIQGNASFGGANVAYECPPLGYQGNSGCNLSIGGPRALIAVTRSRVVHPTAPVTITKISFVRSGVPFPSVLYPNAGPFGTTVFEFPSATGRQGLPLPLCGPGEPDAGMWGCASNDTYINFCQTDPLIPLNVSQSATCTAGIATVQSRTLSLQGLVYTAYGNFTNDGGQTLLPSNWHMDDNRKLLIIEPYPEMFWFNATGCFVAAGGQCTYLDIGAFTYSLEVYNYDSRFLDYVETVSLSWKFASGGRSVIGKSVDVWMGNSIDAAGPFPCLMYTDTVTGYYVGLDRITPFPGQPTGSYWYNDVTGGTASISQVDLPQSCGPSPITKSQWMGNP
jgi:hypothetical protein